MQGQGAHTSPLSPSRAPRLLAAVVAGRLVRDASRLLGRGSGSTYPGVLAQRIAPDVLRRLSAQLALGSVLVAGTNGKTTTSRMLARMLRCAGRRPVHNRAGANMLAGVTGAVVTHTALTGRPVGDVGLFEVDEASVPAVMQRVRPRLALLLNLFRDQLDRYGELDRLAALWSESLFGPDGPTTVVLNADDPGLAALAGGAHRGVVWYGIDDRGAGAGVLPHAADATYCLCGNAFTYDAVHYGHLGHWRCDSCGRARPVPDVAAVNIRGDGLNGTHFELRWGDRALDAFIPLPGLYNVSNAAAAAAAARALGLSESAVLTGLRSVTAAFGRLERVRVRDRDVVLWLVKNPAGFNEALRTLLQQPGRKTVVIIINDRTADGRDVSWLWDADLEMLTAAGDDIVRVICAGSRAYDMAVRLKYAGFSAERQSVRVQPLDAVLHGLSLIQDGAPLYVFPTYTAMLELREQLRRQGWVGRVWDD